VTETERGGERGRDGYGAAEERGVAGKKRRRLDSGGTTGMGLESRTLGAQPGRGSSRGWSDVVTGAGSVVGGQT
jgi:hypothetical protein